MGNNAKSQNLNRLYYFVDLYLKKVDLGIKYFVMRVEALRKKDKEKAEFIENQRSQNQSKE